MSALRDAVETAGAPLLSVHKRVDALLLAAADQYRKLDAVAAILRADALPEEVPEAQLREAYATLLDPTARDGIYEAEERMVAHSPEKIAEYKAEQERLKRSQPPISTDRSPRRSRVDHWDGTKVPGETIIAPDGTVLGKNQGGWK